ncbi:MAG: DNA polymerase/3'-5' exonuclease PolX [Chloroflexi bacterium]|nr:DNA polymerase/3'-5' exonuclease PolX [Chloroflexota bacterium]
MPDNQTLAALFKRIALLLELKGENPYKIRAYRRAAEALTELDVPATVLWEEQRLTEIPGVGDAIAKKIDEYLRTGHLTFLERLEAEVPPSLIELTQLPGLGPKKVRRLWQELGITNLDALEKAAQEGRLRALSGFGPKSEARILEAIHAHRARPQGFLLGQAYPTALHLLEILRALPEIAQAEMAGSVRRGKAMVHDLELLLAAASPTEALQAALNALHAEAEIVVHPDYAEAEIQPPEGLPIHLIAAQPARWGTAWVFSTGSKTHLNALRDLATAQGHNPEAPFPTETAYYAALGLPWIPPELREGQGEIEAAQTKRLPNLITANAIQAELHSHSTWSDGRASIREMAEAALARGLRVLAITDHSQSLGVAHGLTPERLRAQKEEIRAVQAALGNQILLLQGAEVEILADGSLDYPDDVLAELDVVVASLHTSLRQPRERITERLLRAIRNPFVHIIGHPSGRLLPHRAGADLDWEAVLTAAAASGVALEINAHPRRLDLDDEHVRQAIDRGIPLAINTDAHTPTDFDNRFYGVLTARRGWATADHVINTREPKRLLAWLKQKSTKNH